MSDITLAIGVQADDAVNSVNRLNSALDGLSRKGADALNITAQLSPKLREIGQGGNFDAMAASFSKMQQSVDQLGSRFQQSADKITASIRGQTLELTKSIDKLAIMGSVANDAGKKAEAGFKVSAAAAKDYDAQLAKLDYTLGRIERTDRDYAVTLANLNKLYHEGAISSASYQTRLASLNEAVEGNTSKLKMNGGAFREVMVILHELGTGNTSRLAGSAFVLLGERTNILQSAIEKMTFSGGAAVAGVAVLAAGFVAAAARAASLSQEIRTLQGLQAALGTGSGMTPQQLQQMGQNAVQSYGMTRTDAMASMQKLASTQNLSSSLYNNILQSSVGVSKVLGTEVPDATSKMADAFSSGAQGILKLNEQLNFLDKNSAKAVIDLTEQGKSADAASLAMQALSEHTHASAVVMETELEKAAHGVRAEWSHMLDTFAQSSMANTFVDQLEKALTLIAATLHDISNFRLPSIHPQMDIGPDGPATPPEKALTENIAQLEKLQSQYDSAGPNQKEALENVISARLRNIAALQKQLQSESSVDNGPKSSGAGVSYLAMLEKETEQSNRLSAASPDDHWKVQSDIAVEKWRLTPNAASLNPEDRAKAEQLMRDKAKAEWEATQRNDHSGDTSKGEDATARILAQAAAEKQLAAAWETGNIAEVHRVELEKAIALASVGKTDEQKASIDAAMREADASKQLLTAEQHRYAQMQQMNAANQNMSYLGMGEDAAKRAKAENDVTKWYRDQYGAIADLKPEIRKVYEDELARADAIANQTIAYEQQKAALDELGKFGDQVFERLGSAITQAFTQGNGAAINFQSIFKGIQSEITQELIKLAAINPIKNMISGGSSLPTLGGVMNAVSGGGGSNVIQLVQGSSPGGLSYSYAGGGSSSSSSSGWGVGQNDGGFYSSGALGGGSASSSSSGMSLMSGLGNLSSLSSMFGSGGSSLWGSAGSLSGYLFGNAGGIASDFVGPMMPGQLAQDGWLGSGGISATMGALTGAPETMAMQGLAGGTMGDAVLPGIGALIGAGMSFANGQYGSGAGTLAGAGIGTVILPGIGTAIGGMLGGIIGGLFDGGSSHGPSSDSMILTGGSTSKNPSNGVGFAYDAAGYANRGLINNITNSSQLDTNQFYALNQGEAHHGGDSSGVIATNEAFASSLNQMIAQYQLKLTKQWSGLLISGDNSNPGFGSTDAMMMNLANKKYFSGSGNVGEVFQMGGWKDAKTLQAALTQASQTDQAYKGLSQNSYQTQQDTLDTNYNLAKVQNAKYGISNAETTAIYEKQTQQNMAQAQNAAADSVANLTQRTASLTGGSVAAAEAVLKASQADEMLKATQDKLTDTTKLAAVQAAEYAQTIADATEKMMALKTSFAASGLTALGQTVQAAFAQIAQNAYATVIDAVKNGNDINQTVAIVNVNSAKAQAQAVLTSVQAQASVLQQKLQQSGTLRDAVTSMADSKLTPQEAYDTAISRFTSNLALAKGGNLDALSKITSYGQAAVNAESTYSGGTQTTVYNQVTKGLSSLADQLDQQNGISYDVAKDQLNTLQQLQRTASLQLNTSTEAISDLQNYETSALAAYQTAVATLQSMQGSFAATIAAIPSISSAAATAQGLQTSASAVPSSTTTSATPVSSSTYTDTVSAPAPVSAADLARSKKLSASINDGSYLNVLTSLIKASPSDGAVWSEMRSFNKASPSASNQDLFSDLVNHGLVPGYASGTNYAPGGWSIIGERGPEMMYVPRGATILPTGTPAGNDDALINEIRALRAEVASLRQATVAGAMHVASTVADGNTDTKRLAQAADRASYAPTPVARAA